MPINTPTGYLDITNATLRGSKIVTTGFVGIANANPTNHLSIGSNLHINDTHSNVLQISGNINAASVVLGGISIAPTFDLEIVTNTGNTTPYTVEFNNTATAFVTTANATIGDTLTASKLVGDGSGISAIQSSNVSDFGSNVSRITTLETDLGNNSARITNLSSNLSDNSARITNLSSNLSDNSARITNLSSNLSDNSSRITALESGDISISGDKTFTGDIIFESNVHMNGGNVFVANTVNLTVSDPIIELGSNNIGANDLGIIMTRPNNNSNVAVVFDESVDILRMGYTLNGANDSIVDLDSNALAVSVQGALSAASVSGDGSGLTSLNASNITTGALSTTSVTIDDYLIHDGDTDTKVGFPLADTFTVTTANSERIRVDSSGNVGIGTDSPAYTLDVHGTANVGALYSTLTYSNAASNIVTWNSSTNEIIDSGLEKGFTEHPVVPMTDYVTKSEFGTYEASASSEYTGGNYAHGVFNYSTSSVDWLSATAAYNASTGVYEGSYVTTDVGGTRYAGEYLELKLPYSIILSHSRVMPWDVQRAPADGVILGSNDGNSWYKLTEFSGESYTSSTWKRLDVNATTPYARYRLVFSKVGTGQHASVTEWRLFAEKDVTKMENVHISGDLSSETLQTGYIKWPRKPLKGNESEGYVASASSSLGFAQYVLFNERLVGLNTEYWSTSQTYNTSTGAHDNTVSTTDVNGATHYGEWAQIQLPQKIALSFFKVYPRAYNADTWVLERSPNSGSVLGSDDGVNWYLVNKFSGITYTLESTKSGEKIDIQSSKSYKYYRFVFTSVQAGGSGAAGDRIDMMELQLFEAATGVGAPPTSAKLQVHGSLGLAKGSALYAGDSVVAEFPKHDQPLTKYPEIPITSSATIGGYTATASSYVNREAWQAFDNSDTTSWTSNYGYSGSPLTGDEYLQLELPVAIKVVKMYIKAYASVNYQLAPQDAELLGSNDGTNWVSLNTSTDLPLESYGASTWVHVNATQYYKYLRLKITKIYSGSTSYARVADLQYWGTEEGDESVDVVHRSVPNKPGQQQLSVWIDPGNKDSYSLGDNSKTYDLVDGRAGNLYGDKVFDPEFNSWYLDGSGDDIDGTITTTTGAWVHSISCWVKNDTVNYASGELFALGTANGSQMVGLRFNGTDVMRYYFYSNDVIFHVKNNSDRWLHVVATYDGGSSAQANEVVGVNRKLYVNGEECLVQATTSVGALNLQASSHTYYVGRAIWSGAQQKLKGYYGGLRVYNKVLSREQVLELFDEGAERFGLREDLVSVHKGNLGIGLRDPEQRLVVKPQTDVGYFPQTQITHTGDFAYLHDNNSNARTFNVWTEKDGLLRVGCSTFFAGGNSNPLYPFQVFNTSGYRWQDSGAKYSTNTGNYTGSSSTTVDGTSRSGEYIEIVFGQPIQVEKFIMNVNLGGNFQNRGARTGVIAAKNYEDDSFTAVYELSGHAWNTNQDYEFVPSSSAPYRHYRFVIETLQGGTASDSASLTKWQFYGKYASTCNGAVLKTGGVVTGGVIAEAVSLGGKSSEAPLTVGKPAGGGAAMTSAASHWITNTGINSTTQRVVTEAHSGISIYALGNILTRQYLVSASGTLQSSDRRIKTNIADVNDSSALEAFRLIKPKLYNYTDVTRGSLPVWGFIAQEVGEVLNHSTQTRTEYIPNVYELANVFAEGTVLEFDTTKLQPGASELRLYDAGGAEQDALIDEIVDEFTVRMSKPVDSRDRVFVFGQRVNDFTLLKKDAIWTTAAAALQQVDRELQAEKAKTKALESKLAGERVPLENAEGLAVDANHAPCVKPNDPLFLGIVDADGRVAAKGKRAKVWVTNIGAPLSAGDIIATTSNIAGYCTKLTDLTEVHRAVGKVLVDVALPQVTDHNFVAPAVPRRRKVTETSDVTVWVREFKSTAEQYATLGEDERRVRDEVYYARDDVAEVVRNEYVDKMPAYDVEAYHRTQIDTCDAEIYEALPDSEKVNYVLGEDGVYTYTHVNMITIDAWNALGDDDERDSFVHGYFKNTTTELTEDEWEALEDSVVQARYERRTRPVYFRLIVARESRHGYTEEVRAETVDVLDAFGRPTFENVEGETDPAFEFRYLKSDGSITDRHSGVHMAAMVECLLT